MKKTILIIALMAFTLSVFAQSKKDTTVKKKPAISDTAKKTIKPVYEKFFKISPDLLGQLQDAAHGFRDVLIYSPFILPEDKLKSQGNLDYLSNQLSKALKLDSALVK